MAANGINGIWCEYFPKIDHRRRLGGSVRERSIKLDLNRYVAESITEGTSLLIALDFIVDKNFSSFYLDRPQRGGCASSVFKLVAASYIVALLHRRGHMMQLSSGEVHKRLIRYIASKN